ncbi:MAG TPA: DUF4910 domain-containing protein, partial [Flavisolibacter sp.]
EVAIEYFPADGAAQWWTFRAPASWTPVRAGLTVHHPGFPPFSIDHLKQPFSLATYSVPTPPGGSQAKLVFVSNTQSLPGMQGAVAVLGKQEFESGDMLSRLAACGALGFVTDAACRSTGNGKEEQGRIELSQDTPLFGFSILSRDLKQLKDLALAGAQAHVSIEVERSARMPVVTALLPGRQSSPEVWLIAHLCHPRPGANDNASGVAALLGIAAAYTAAIKENKDWRPDRNIRFVWGPEFLGVTALLHRHLARQEAFPCAVINLDMVGENQQLCGGPFVVERPPDSIAGWMAPVAEYITHEVFSRTAEAGGEWVPMPFMGFSDHSVFVTFPPGAMAAQVVQFCHVDDRFNHSSGDSVDKVSEVEMLRATVAGAALSYAAANSQALQKEIGGIVNDWCVMEGERMETLAARYASSHQEWAEGLLQYTAARNAALRSGKPPVNSEASAGDGKYYSAGWQGPLNIRAMLTLLRPQRRAEVSGLIRSDKNNYTVLLLLALGADGQSTRSQIIRRASFSLQKPLDSDTAQLMFDALLEAGVMVER